MIDAKKLLDQLIGSGVAGGLAGGLAGGALAGALSGKKPRKVAGKVLQAGGLALVGGLAYKAWQNYLEQSGAASPAAGAVSPSTTANSAFLPDGHAEAARLSMLLARAVISAAKADGQIDAEENHEIFKQINSLDLGPEDKAFLLEQYSAPVNLPALAAAVDSPEHAAEVYAASVMTLDPPSPPERAYLDDLASQLALAPGLVRAVHQSVRSADRDAA